MDMARKSDRPEQIIPKLRAIEVHIAKGLKAEEAGPLSSEHRHVMRRVLISIVVVTLFAGSALCEEGEVPWWKQGKINFMWGLWGLSSRDLSHPMALSHPQVRPVPRETFRNAALAGATVFADLWQYNPLHARLAKEHGLRYFSNPHLHHMTWKPGGRKWINEEGEEVEKKTSGGQYRCPLDEGVYESWMADARVQEGIRAGLVDGIHIDWESTEGGICYCDVCFSRFLKVKGIKAEPPKKAKRFSFIRARNLETAYEENFHEQRFEMFTRIRKKLQAMNPMLMFSSYGTIFTDFTRAMHTPEVPFMSLDARHYMNDDRRPWWESYSARLREEGYLYIAGSWTNALFGAVPSQTSAARWIYEAMVNEDGVWLWFEHEMLDEVLTAYATADRQVRAVEGAVGDFLLSGRRDPGFVTVVEWTGNPQLEKATVQCTYHLEDNHLVHVNNVNAEWPVRVRIRFPYLEDGTWTAQDPMGGAYYTHDGKSAVWSPQQLGEGIVVSLDARSDLFARILRAKEDPAKSGARLIRSRDFNTMPAHDAGAATAAQVKAPDTLPKTGWRFRMDVEDAGIAEKWFMPAASVEGWTCVDIEEFWGNKGGVGAGWYRRSVEIPRLPEDKRFYLHFGAADEQLKLWIDGEYVGEYNRGPGGWDKPFAMDVTGLLREGECHLAFRVYNSAHAGGVWKPVSVLAAPATDRKTVESVVYNDGLDTLMSKAKKVALPFSPGPAGLMVVTATRQLLSEGSSGRRCFVNNAIHVADVGGNGSLQLRHLRGHLWSPSYSPDGRRIAFVHDAGGRGQIHAMNADGSGAVNLSDNAFCDRSPVWSPDGKRLAFISDRTGDWQICVMNADGSDQSRVAGNRGADRAPAWSPDGGRIAWESHVSGMPTIWICDADGGKSRPLAAPDKPFEVHRGETGKDGVFAFAEADWPFEDHAVYLTDPLWSPDGKRIAARGLGQTGVMLAVLDADGSRMLQVIDWIGGMDELVWSPDGSQLAGTLRTAPQETDRSGVFVVEADGSEKYRWMVDVRPQGPRLGGAIRTGVPTWYSHGSAQPRRVMKTFDNLTWSPDGETLAFSSDMAEDGAFYVYTIPAKGGEPTRLPATKSAWPNEVMFRKVP